MPELPEVETMRRIVERELVGRGVETVDLRLAKLIRTSPLPNLDLLIDQRVVEADRRAKVLIVGFSGDLSLLAHFKLSGQLAVEAADGRRSVAGHPVPDPVGTYPHKATHVIVEFRGGVRLYLSDVRQFGWLRLMPTADVPAALERFRFGPEAVGPEAITTDHLANRLARRRIPIKLALLDQGVVAGLGNIYVDEALHDARLHPETPAHQLGLVDVGRLRASIVWALEQGLTQGGAKIVHNRAYPIDGFPRVHARVGDRCETCGTTIVKTRVGARGTYLCPVCQPVMTSPAAVPSFTDESPILA